MRKLKGDRSPGGLAVRRTGLTREGEARCVSSWPFSALAQVTWDQVVTWATAALLLLSRSCTGVLAEMLPYLGAPQSHPSRCLRPTKVPWKRGV